MLTGCFYAFRSRNSSENLVRIYLRTVSKPEPAPRIHDEIRRKTWGKGFQQRRDTSLQPAGHAPRVDGQD